MKKNKITIGLIMLAAAILVYQSVRDQNPPGQASAETTAQSVKSGCEGPYEEECYNKLLSGVTRERGLSFAGAVLKELQKTEPNLWRCHIVGHRIGTTAAASSPDGWKDLLAQIDPTECSYGIFHGIIESYMGAEPDFSINEKTFGKLCEPNTKGTGACVHVLGHFALFEREGNLEETLSVCQYLPKNLSTEIDQCLSGVLMEYMDNTASKDHGLPNIKEEPTEDIEKLCASLKTNIAKACWGELAYRYASMATLDPNPARYLFNSCKKANEPESINKCYFTAASSFALSANKQEDINGLCRIFNDQLRQNKCIEKSINAMMQHSTLYVDRVVEVCLNITDKLHCFNVLKNSFLAKTDGSQLGLLCEKVPETYRSICQQ